MVMMIEFPLLTASLSIRVKRFTFMVQTHKIIK